MSYIRIRGYVCKVGVHREGVHMHARLPGLQSSPGAAVALVSCPAEAACTWCSEVPEGVSG